ncbi:MAG: YceI family protein [Bacteroidota bacterium]
MITQKTIQLTGLVLVSTILFSFSSFYFSSWNISDDYNIRFSGRGADGTFSGLQGTINFDPANLANARMDVSVDVKTISTGNNTKNKHARGDSWFDAETYPKITFRSEQFRKKGQAYEVVGDLTLHGTTKEVTIPFTFTENTNGGLFVGTFTVDRQEYGIEGPLLAFTVGDDFEIELRVPVRGGN